MEEPHSEADCLQLASKLRQDLVALGHWIPEIVTIQDITAQFFAYLYVVLCGPYVQDSTVEVNTLESDETSLLQAVIDALAVDIVSMAIPLDVDKIVSRQPADVYQLLDIFNGVSTALQQRPPQPDGSDVSSSTSSTRTERLTELGRSHQNSPTVSYAKRLKKFYGQFGKKSVLYSPNTTHLRSFFPRSNRQQQKIPMIKRPVYDNHRHLKYLHKLNDGSFTSPRVTKAHVEGLILETKVARLEQDLRQMPTCQQLLANVHQYEETPGDRRRYELELRALGAQSSNVLFASRHRATLLQQTTEELQRETVKDAVLMEHLRDLAKDKVHRDLERIGRQQRAEREKFQLHEAKKRNSTLKQKYDRLDADKQSRIQLIKEKLLS